MKFSVVEDPTHQGRWQIQDESGIVYGCYQEKSQALVDKQLWEDYYDYHSND